MHLINSTAIAGLTPHLLKHDSSLNIAMPGIKHSIVRKTQQLCVDSSWVSTKMHHKYKQNFLKFGNRQCIFVCVPPTTVSQKCHYTTVEVEDAGRFKLDISGHFVPFFIQYMVFVCFVYKFLIRSRTPCVLFT